MQFFTVESQSKYHIEVKEIKDISEAGDDFITDEELFELLGGDARDRLVFFMGPRLFTNRIVAELETLKKEMLKKNKRSILIHDEDLVAALSMAHTEYCCGSGMKGVSDFVSGLRRVGNRLYLHTPKKKTAPKPRDAKRYINFAISFISKKNKITLEVRGELENVNEKSLTFISNLVNWEEFSDWVAENEKKYAEDLYLYKQLHDNPGFFANSCS